MAHGPTVQELLLFVSISRFQPQVSAGEWFTASNTVCRENRTWVKVRKKVLYLLFS